MAIFEGFARQMGLMDRMADVLGADIRAEGPAVHRNAALRCAGCGATETCKSWLDRQTTADSAPDFCRNKDLMDRLALPG